jgi:glycosyltransferase involved in cell wall biosynthesis
MSEIGVSIVICCYNSAKVIEQTLSHICNQKTQGIQAEIILVDNNCTDQTIQKANSFINSKHPSLPVRIVSQPIPGLSSAREKGINEAKYDIIVLVDDDNRLDAEYVMTALQILQSDKTIAAAGGIGVPLYEITPPENYNSFAHLLATGPQSESSGDITKKGYLYGAGLIIRKSIYLKVRKGGFNNILSDRKGKELSSGGDTELCLILALSGYKIWYDERLKFDHFITKDRINWSYLHNLAFSLGKAKAYLDPYFIVKDSKQKYGWKELLSGYQYPLKKAFRQYIFSGMKKYRKVNLMYWWGVYSEVKKRNESINKDILNLKIKMKDAGMA